MYVYKFNDFAIFSAVILNLFKKGILKEEVLFTECCMELSALIKTKKGEKKYIFLDLSSRVLYIYEIVFFNKKKLLKKEYQTDLYNLYTVLKNCSSIILS